VADERQIKCFQYGHDPQGPFERISSAEISFWAVRLLAGAVFKVGQAKAATSKPPTSRKPPISSDRVFYAKECLTPNGQGELEIEG